MHAEPRRVKRRGRRILAPMGWESVTVSNSSHRAGNRDLDWRLNPLRLTAPAQAA